MRIAEALDKSENAEAGLRWARVGPPLDELVFKVCKERFIVVMRLLALNP